MRLRCVSWNIHKGIGGLDRQYRLERIAEVLRQLDPDIALLQEVADGWPRAAGDFQASKLSTRLPLKYQAFYPEHRFTVGGYGNAILSRFPLTQVKHVDLTLKWRKKRGCIQAQVQIPDEQGSKTLLVNNMHLGLLGPERETQLLRFFHSDEMKGIHEGTPIVIGGDLNDLWGSLGAKLIEPRGFRRAGQRKNTFPAYAPLRPLDAIFTNCASGKSHVAHMNLAKVASDHRPLVADLEI